MRHSVSESERCSMLEAAWSPKTRLLVLNSPLNPSASMIGSEELAVIARFCIERDLIAICDEVWEELVFDGARHIPLIGQPRMGWSPAAPSRRRS